MSAFILNAYDYFKQHFPFLGTPASNMVLVAASYSKVNLQHQQSNQEMELQWDSKLCLKTPLSILNYVGEKCPTLMGKNKAQVMQWVMYSLGKKFNFDLTKNSEIMEFFVISGDAVSFSLTWVLNKKDKKAKEMLDQMEVYLKTRTFLAGERLSLADISLAMAYLPMYQFVMDSKLRSKYPNNTRWFNTCINQPNFLKVLGNVKLCEK